MRPLRLVPEGHALAAPSSRHVNRRHDSGGSEGPDGQRHSWGSRLCQGLKNISTSSPGAPGQGLLAELTGQVPSRLLHNASPSHPAGLSSRSQSLYCSQLISVPGAGARGRCLERLGPHPGGQATYRCCCSGISTSWRPHGLQHARLPCPSPFLGAWSNSYPSNHLTLCRLLVLLPPVFPSTRVFSNELALHIRRPKYWRFSVSISPSNEYSGLISVRIDWLDLLAVQGTLKSLLQHRSSKTSVLQRSAFFMVQLSHPDVITIREQYHARDMMTEILKPLKRLR